jgi:iron(III) transport system substrate-binding protein
VSLVLVGTMALAISACGDDTDTAATTTTAAAAGDTATTAASSGATSLDELYAAAQEEGELVVYSSQAQAPLEQLAEAFEAEYPGIDVEAIRGIDGDLAPQVETEQATGGVASFYVSASQSWVEPHAEMGWFLPPVGPELEGEGSYDAEQFVHEGNHFEVGSAVLTLGWNSDLYPQGLTSYEDLLDPELQGRIGVAEPAFPSIVDFYLWMEESFGEQFVDDLAAQEPQIYTSAVAIGEALAAGEIAASPYVTPQTIIPLRDDQGAPVDFAVDDVGAWAARYFGMVLASGPAPNAAQLFANFMVTPEGQSIVMANAGSVAVDSEGTVAYNADVREQDLSKLTPEAVTAYQQRFDSLFR